MRDGKLAAQRGPRRSADANKLHGMSVPAGAVHHLSCGTMCPAVAPLINGQGSFFRAGRMVCHVLLLETKAGLVLVDTGIGAQAIRDPKRWLDEVA